MSSKAPKILLTLGSLLLLLIGSGHAQQDTALVRSFGGKGVEKGVDLVKSPDNGLMILGNSGEYGNGSSDLLLVKTDSNGIFEWSKALGTSDLELGTSISPVSDSAYIISGFTDRQLEKGYEGLLAKVDTSGDLLWSKTYGSMEWDRFNDLAIGPNGGFLLVGNSYEANSSDIWVVKTNSLGDPLWSKTFVDPGYDEAHSVIRTSDTSYSIAGEISQHGPGEKAMFQMEIEENGDSLWMQTYGDTAEEIAYGISIASEGDRLLTGSTSSFSDGDLDGFNLRTDSLGDLKWSRLEGGSAFYGSPVQEDDVGKDIIETPDSNILVNGMTESFGLGGKGMYMIMRSSGGNFQVAPTFGEEEDDLGESLLRMGPERTAFLGTTRSYGGGQEDIYLVITDTMVNNFILDTATFLADPTPTSLNKKESREEFSFSLYPNPSSGRTKLQINRPSSKGREPINITVTDMRGRTLRRVKIRDDSYELDTSPFEKGLYQIILHSEAGASSSLLLMVE